GIDFPIKLVVRDQLANRAVAFSDLIYQPLELSDGRVQAVIERRIVDQFADRSLPALDECNDAVETLEQSVHVLERALAGANHVRKIRDVAARQGIAVKNHIAFCLRAVYVDVSLAEHTGGREQGQRVTAKTRKIRGVYLHRDFNRS